MGIEIDTENVEIGPYGQSETGPTHGKTRRARDE
jgi:hypothetical protein